MSRSTYIFRAQTLSLQFCYGRSFYSRPPREVLVHCRLEVAGSGGRFDNRYFLLCGQIEKSSLCLFREGHVKAIWTFSVVYKLHLPVVGRYSCAFSRTFHVAMWSAVLSFSFQMRSLSDVADDFCLSLNLDVCWLYRVLNSFSVIPMYMPSFIVLVCVTVAW